MDKLPFDVLYLICSMTLQEGWGNLTALSLVNSKTRDAAVPYLYRRMTLDISSLGQLQETAIELLTHTARRQFLTHMRVLTISAFNLTSKSKDKDGQDLQEARRFAEHHLPGCTEYWSAAKLEPIYEEVCTFRSVTGTCRNPKSDSWLPIAVLIANAHHLNELNYDCLDPIAPCLLAALGDYHPSCKLRLGKFRLPTLRESQIRQYELNLIQNPRLHALSAEIQMSRDVNDLEVMEAVRYAPRLREVKLNRFYDHRHHDGTAGSSQSVRPLPNPADKTKPQGKLSCLSFVNMPIMTQNRLEQWTQATDFSKLHTLVLGKIDHPRTMDLLARPGVFIFLRSLDLTLQYGIQDVGNRAVTEMFFENLPHLDSLTIDGAMDAPLLRKILGCHGHSLTDFRLYPTNRTRGSIPAESDKLVITPRDIEEIARTCPRLQLLGITIKRTKGDFRETASYDALARFQSLKWLELGLDCDLDPRSPDEMDDPSLNEFDRQWYHTDLEGQVLHRVDARDAIANCAIDETLARSIWAIIRSSRRNLTSLGITPLRPDNMPHSLFNIICYIARDYRVEGNHVDDRITVTNLNEWLEEELDEDMFQMNPVSMEEVKLNKEIMRRIWPIPRNCQNWHAAWSSLPLQRSS